MPQTYESGINNISFVLLQNNLVDFVDEFGVMRPEEHSYADHYFENTIVPVGESSPQIKMMNKGSQNPKFWKLHMNGIE